MLTLKADKIEDPALDLAIVKLFDRMGGLDPETKEYSNTADQLVKLYKLREETTSRKRVSPDALVQVAGSLAGIVAILSYERTQIITTKALGFVMKALR